MSDFNSSIIAEFRANHGQVGGPFAGAPLLILHSTGAKTGETRESPMMYLKKGEKFLIFASKAGAPTNPAWYHNLIAHPAAVIEVGDEKIQVTAEALVGDARDQAYREQAELYPGFADYEKKTTRTIPVLALTPVPEIGI